MLIYVDGEDTRRKLEKDFSFHIPLYCVFDTVARKYNSPLWFEMYWPSEEVFFGLEEYNKGK